MAMSKVTFGEPKIFIRSASGGQEDWTELTAVKMNDTLSPVVADEFVSEWTKALSKPTPISFSCTVRWKGKWPRIRLLQEAGFLDKPKCTYKTVKRFSAKRNRL